MRLATVVSGTELAVLSMCLYRRKYINMMKTSKRINKLHKPVLGNSHICLSWLTENIKAKTAIESITVMRASHSTGGTDIAAIINVTDETTQSIADVRLLRVDGSRRF